MAMMSRAQRLLLAYLLYEVSKPRIIQQITQAYRGGGATMQIHGNEFHDPDFLPLSGGTMTGALKFNMASTAIQAVADGVASLGTVNYAWSGVYADLIWADQYVDTDVIRERTTDAEVSFPDDVKVDHFHEYTADHGIDAEGVLLKEGGVTVGGSGCVDIAGNKLLSTNLSLIPITVDDFAVYNRVGDTLKNFRCARLITHHIYAYTSNAGVFETRASAAAFWAFYGNAVECARLTGGGGVPEFGVSRAGDITMLDQKMMTLGTYTDAQRPAAGTQGRVIFNTDDGMPNYDDGTNWRDINGNIT